MDPEDMAVASSGGSSGGRRALEDLSEEKRSMAALEWSWEESKAGRPLKVRLQREDQEVEVADADLARDEEFDGIMELLKGEVAPLDVWLHFAVAYYRAGQKELFRALLQQVILVGDSIAEFYSDDPDRFKIGRLRIVNALAADSMKEALMAPQHKDHNDPHVKTKTDYNDQAVHFFSLADGIDSMSALTWVTKGIFNLTNNWDLNKSRYYFQYAGRSGVSLPGLLGQAAIHFYDQDYKKAQEKYAEAIKLNPKCSASVRVGFGLCCYRLGQTERALAAFERARQLDKFNVNALINSAVLLMQLSPEANGNEGGAPPTSRSERALQRVFEAYHASQRAKKNNAMVLNHLANHRFWQYAKLKPEADAVVVPGSDLCHLTAPGGGARAAADEGRKLPELSRGDYIRIGSSFMTRVTAVADGGEFRVADPWPAGTPGGGFPITRRDFGRVLELARKALDASESPASRAESTFLMGRVHHAMGNMREARDCYADACSNAPKLAPAQYGLAQMLLLEKDWEGATECLRAVLQELPACAEALVLLAVLQAMRDERRAALGSFKRALELDPKRADVWVAQAQAQQGEPADHEGALASYSRALALTLGPGSTPLTPAERRAAYNNVGVLNEHLGRLPQAEQAYASALELPEGEEVADAGLGNTLSLIYEPANRVFWTWRRMPGVRASVGPNSSVLTVVPGAADVEEGDESLLNGQVQASPPLASGQQIRIGGERNGLVTTIVEGPRGKAMPEGTFQIADVVPASRAPSNVALWRKVQRMPLSEDACTTAFNVALLHERRGQHRAAAELYRAILYYHPTHVDCYIRLSCVARDQGNINLASRWLSTAQALDPLNKDVLSYLGNLHAGSGEWNKAQKLFEKVLESEPSPGPADCYGVLSLGNIYFSNLDDKGKFDKHLQYAASYYKQVLSVDTANAYAANGIGMIMAEKENLEAARDVFARVREVSAESMGDVWVNQAHVFAALRKHHEAVKMYQLCLRRTPGGRDASLHLFLASVYFEMQRMDDCRATLLKGLRLFPNDLQLWYNLALTRESFAVSVLQREQKGERRTLEDVQHALGDLMGAEALFKWLADGQEREPDKRRRLPYSTERARKHRGFCQENITRANEHLQHERVKAQQEREMRERRLQAAQKEAEMQREAAEEADRRRREAEDLLAERARSNENTVRRVLENLQSRQREKEAGAARRSSGGGGRRRGGDGGRRRGGGGGNAAASDDDSEVSDGDAGVGNRGGGGGSAISAAAAAPPAPDRYGNVAAGADGGGAAGGGSTIDVMRDIGLASSEDSSDDEDVFDDSRSPKPTAAAGSGSGGLDDEEELDGGASPASGGKRGRDEGDAGPYSSGGAAADGAAPPPASRPRHALDDDDDDDI